MLLHKIGQSIIGFSDLIWGYPLLVLLLGGGLFLLIYSRFSPLLYVRHALSVLTGRFNDPGQPGQISHYQALSTAVSGFVGMGNVSSVAVAIVLGGPGSVFWMWVTAVIGMTTQFFTSTLSIMYRGKDSNGELQGGPMYYIVNGMGRKWKFLAIFFSAFGMIGVTSIFQSNQLTQAIRDVVLIPNQVKTGAGSDLVTGLILGGLVALVVFGGIRRIGNVAGKLVPFMVIAYIAAVLVILCSEPGQIIPGFRLIFRDAFTANAVLGGSVGSLMIVGVRRAVFSNEAGIGTAPLAHGAAKTDEPVRQGLVAMLGPVIDTLIICTMTALAIIITGVWNTTDDNGITLTANAFDNVMPGYGPYVLTVCVSIFALTTMFAYPYYGAKCFNFIFGCRYTPVYMVFYLVTILAGAMTSLRVVISVIDASYALMAFPTMISTMVLAPRAMKEARRYFLKLKSVG